MWRKFHRRHEGLSDCETAFLLCCRGSAEIRMDLKPRCLLGGARFSRDGSGALHGGNHAIVFEARQELLCRINRASRYSAGDFQRRIVRSVPSSGSTRAKGLGCISRENGPDVFVHFRAINGSGFRTLQEGQRLSFKIVQGRKGGQAEDVTAA